MTDIDRRTLLVGLGAAAGAAVLPAPTAKAEPQAGVPAIKKNLPDVTVVGAGAFGAWTALCLREKGANVMLLDSYGAGNARQASGDETRQIRSVWRPRNLFAVGQRGFRHLAQETRRIQTPPDFQ
jgi:hypothetical protein